MSTGIEWTDESWNPLRGCSRVSPGCEHCYAERQAARPILSGPGKPYEGLVRIGRQGPRWTGATSHSDVHGFMVPLRKAQHHTFQVLTKRAERMAAWFARLNDNGGAETWAEEWTARTQGVNWGGLWPGWPLPNVWIGVSAEDQQRADERIPHLLQVPAAVRFVSYEPALEAVDWNTWLLTATEHYTERHELNPPPRGFEGVPFVGNRCLRCGFMPGACSVRPWPNMSCWECGARLARPGFDWLIIGGESGPGARPFDLAWARSAIEQCRAAGVPCFVKQLGARPRGICDWPHHDRYPPRWLDEDGTLIEVSRRPADDLCHSLDDYWWPCAPKLRHRKGADPSEWPADLRVRECP